MGGLQYLYLGVLCLILAAVFIYEEYKKQYLPAVVFKGLASICFVLLGILGWKATGSAENGKLVVIGLCLGCAADVLLNLRFLLGENGQKVFLVGILVFLTGHVFYLISLISSCKYLVICLLSGVVLTVLILKWIFSKITAKKAFKIFGIFYIGTIVIMTCVALGTMLTIPIPKYKMFFIGALLFLVSDIVLILNTFGSEFKFSLRIANLSLYYVGQVLIALSLQL